MELIKRGTPDFMFPDDRGLLVQVAHDSFRQVNAVFTKKGAVRGRWHYHKTAEEAFFVLQGRIRITAALGEQKETAEFTAGELFTVLPFVRHNVEFLEDTSMVVLYSVPVERPDGTKDIYDAPEAR